MVLTNIHPGNISREIKTIKNEVEILELKRRITDIKNSLGVLWLEMTKKFKKKLKKIAQPKEIRKLKAEKE